MNIQITASRAAEMEGPFQELMAQLLKRSKGAEPSLEGIEWSIDWCQRIKGYSFQEVLSGKAQEEQEARKSLTAEERLSEVLPNLMVNLQASILKGHPEIQNKRRVDCYARIAEVPPEIQQHYLRMYEAEVAEEQRIERLRQENPEQLERETQDLLDQLNGTPGFMSVQVKAGAPAVDNEAED